jgi:hypothetical protein
LGRIGPGGLRLRRFGLRCLGIARGRLRAGLRRLLVGSAAGGGFFVVGDDASLGLLDDYLLYDDDDLTLLA